MRRVYVAFLAFALAGGCGKRVPTAARIEPKAFGAALVEVSGSKQVAVTGAPVDQPLVVQVNDAQGAAVAGAVVSFHAAGGASVEPPEGLTGSDGQFSVNVTLGVVAGRYQVVATTRDKTGKALELRSEEIALGYQQNLGRQLNDRYCSRCHDSESTAERVSNHDNLKAPPHAFTDGAFLNNMSDADLANIITHGGPAYNKSAEMPPYGGTLQKSEIEALIAFIRAVADPPYRLKGLVYAKN
ncbi:MAG TPA: cytochrome c [Bryobacteraceae bacterium]|nr:cytochrome c [Bryobacteraceae bacterium]